MSGSIPVMTPGKIIIDAVPQSCRLECPGGWLEFTMVPVLESGAEGEHEHVAGTPVTISVSAGIDGEVTFIADSGEGGPGA